MLRTIGERVLRELERKLSSPILKDDDAVFKIYLKAPTQERNTKDKIYSLHKPQVACIAKGKSGKAYEFGAKVALVRGRKTGVITSALLAGIGSNLKMRLNQIKPQILLWLELVLRLFLCKFNFQNEKLAF
jgi:IS5 family transposase